jgi:hypothetical protein
MLVPSSAPKSRLANATAVAGKRDTGWASRQGRTEAPMRSLSAFQPDPPDRGVHAGRRPNFDPMPVCVQILVTDRFLASVLATAVAAARGVTTVETIHHWTEVLPENVLITVPADCAPELAAQLVAEGVRLLVLAPSLDSAVAASYARAGARAVPMEISSLVSQVEQALASL